MPSVELKLAPASKAQLETLVALCGELRIIRDATDRAADLVAKLSRLLMPDASPAAEGAASCAPAQGSP